MEKFLRKFKYVQLLIQENEKLRKDIKVSEATLEVAKANLEEQRAAAEHANGIAAFLIKEPHMMFMGKNKENYVVLKQS